MLSTNLLAKRICQSHCLLTTFAAVAVTIILKSNFDVKTTLNDAYSNRMKVRRWLVPGEWCNVDQSDPISAWCWVHSV